MKRVSLIFIGLFWLLLNSQAQTITHLEYFFDSDPGVLNGINVPSFSGGDLVDENIDVSVSGLDPGFHWLYIRTFYDDYTISISQGRRFYIYESESDPAASADLSELEYFFDEDPGPGNGASEFFTNASSVDHDFTVDVTGLDAGFHYLYVRTRDTNNFWSLTQFRKFYVFDVQPLPLESSDILSMEYYFDNDPGPGNGEVLDFTSSGPTIDETLSIPIGDLESGFHHIGVRIQDEDFKWSIVHQRKFYVFSISPLPLASASIQKVEYFFGTDPGTGNGSLIANGLSDDTIDQDFIIDVDGLAPGLHTLSIRVIDADGKGSIMRTEEIEVLNNNIPIVNAAIFSLDENSTNGSVVGTVTSTDADGNDVTYAFAEPNTAFSIDGITGAITVLDSTTIDFELNPSFVITVQATDTNTGVGENDITIDLLDINEAPQVENVAFEIDENSENGIVIGTVLATDPENDQLTYSITNGNGSGIFAIDASTGELSVVDSTGLDFEISTSIVLTIDVSDGELSDESMVTISINDVFENNSPTILNAINDRVYLNGFTSSTINLTDVFEDVDQHTLILNAVSDNTDVVDVDIAGITLTISEVGVGSAIVSVSADDTFGGVVTFDFGITVHPPNEAPRLEFIPDITIEQDENFTFQIVTNDSDIPIQTITYQLDFLSEDKGMEIDSRGEFSWTPDATQTGVHNVLLTVSDGIEEDNQTFKISVSDFVEEPLSAQESTMSSKSIYPNPSYGLFKIDLSSTEFEQINIYSLDGSLVKAFTVFQNEYDIDDLNPGIYSVIIKTNNETIFSKLSVKD
ncbi:MAG: cadherin domain-containing protein [Reichenbachiella sp.]